MLLYLGLPILMHCYREFVIFYQHCVRQRFDGRAPRRAPARHAASYAALSCHSCSAGSGCPALAPGGLAASQTCTSAAPQLHAARMPRGGVHEVDVDRATGRACARGWASRLPQPRKLSGGRAGAARATSRPPVPPASIEQRHRVRHGTRRRIGGGPGKACGSTGHCRAPPDHRCG